MNSAGSKNKRSTDFCEAQEKRPKNSMDDGFTIVKPKNKNKKKKKNSGQKRVRKATPGD